MKTPRQQRAAWVKHAYGITLDEWEAIIEAQDGKCAICGREVELVVDHDHETGKVRGALCRQCNSGLGLLQDSTVVLESALQYLEGEQE